MELDGVLRIQIAISKSHEAYHILSSSSWERQGIYNWGCHSYIQAFIHVSFLKNKYLLSLILSFILKAEIGKTTFSHTSSITLDFLNRTWKYVLIVLFIISYFCYRVNWLLNLWLCISWLIHLCLYFWNFIYWRLPEYMLIMVMNKKTDCLNEWLTQTISFSQPFMFWHILNAVIFFHMYAQIHRSRAYLWCSL
jgi:hypothetical protein